MSDHWYILKRSRGSKVCCFMKASDRCLVESKARALFRDPFILKLTWGLLHHFTGHPIPDEKTSEDHCFGEISLPCISQFELVIVVL